MKSIRFYPFLLLMLLIAGCKNNPEGPLGPAPAFTLTSLDGEEISLSEKSGRVLVIHFGASWCPFCRAEDPNLRALSEKYKDRGVDVLVVNVKEANEKAAEWKTEAGFEFPMLLDREGEVSARFAPPDAQPDLPRDEVMVASNLVIDREGNIRFFSLLDTRSFDAELKQLTKKLDQILEEYSS